MAKDWLLKSGALQTLDAPVRLGTAAPGVPQNLTFTAAGGQGQTSWDAPATVNGSPVDIYHAVLTCAGGGTFDILLSRATRALAFGGLTDGVTYTFTLTAINGFGGRGESTAATATATPAAPDVTDIRTWDPTTDTGPTASITRTLSGKQTINSGSFATTHVDNADASWTDVVPQGDVAIADNNFDCPLIFGAGDTLAHNITTDRVTVKSTLQQTHNRGAQTGAISGLKGSLTHSEISGAADGIQGPGSPNNPAIIDHDWLHGPTAKAFDGITIQSDGAGGWTTTGHVMTQAQINSVQAYVPGMTANPGDFISAAPAGGAHTAYQVLQSGTLESSAVPTTWPTLPFYKGSSVFTSGTALLGCIGPGIHTDGIQFTGGGWTKVTFSIVENFDNACMLVQSATSGATHPVWGVHCDNSIFRAGINYWFYWTGQAANEPDGSTPSGLTRDPSTGTWSVSTKIAKSRPWAVSYKDCWLGTSADGRGPAPDLSNVVSGTRLIVANEATWRANVAAQYPGITTAQLDALWWPAGVTDPATIGLPAFDPTVLEARFQAGLKIGECDMRGAVVLDNVRRLSDNAVITSARTGANFSGGLYVGG